MEGSATPFISASSRRFSPTPFPGLLVVVMPAAFTPCGDTVPKAMDAGVNSPPTGVGGHYRVLDSTFKFIVPRSTTVVSSRFARFVLANAWRLRGCRYFSAGHGSNF